jgi:hypothetical protein
MRPRVKRVRRAAPWVIKRIHATRVRRSAATEVTTVLRIRFADIQRIPDPPSRSSESVAGLLPAAVHLDDEWPACNGLRRPGVTLSDHLFAGAARPELRYRPVVGCQSRETSHACTDDR